MRKTLALLLITLSFNLFAKEPVGYYHLADGKKAAELKSALNDIISNAKMLEYGSDKGHTWEGFYSTDRNEANNRVIDMYSDQPFYQPDFKSVAGMHIEHSLPKSWWGTIVNNAYKDLHHLYPAEGNINTRKNNLPLGEAKEGSYTNGVSFVGANSFGSEYLGNCFEPADEYKGDFARSYLYMSTAYEEMFDKWNSPMMDNNLYPVWKHWAIDLLLKWHREDPVSAKELTRTEKVFAIQGNRNPFIDYPELVEYIWGNATDQIYKFPVETKAYIATPNNWSKIDFGVVMNGGKEEEIILISGDNITMPLDAKLTGRNAQMLSLSTTSFSAVDVNKGTSVTIKFVATNKSAVADTLKLFSDEIDTIRIPIAAIVSSEFLGINPNDITATSATLKWMAIPDATDYEVSLYNGKASVAGDLFISTYLEGSSNNKALEIFNATGKSIDLSNYSIKIQSNGIGDFSGEIRLSGTLENNKGYILVNDGAFGSADPDLIAYADNIVPLGYNGNDAVALFHNGIILDIVGERDVDVEWGKDITLIRSTGNPSVIYNSVEWITRPVDSFNALKSYKFVVPEPATLVSKFNTPTHSYNFTDLNPAQTYHYTVRSGESKADNIIHFKTLELEPPVTLEALNIYANQFDANWEAVPGAKSYLLNLYEISGPGFSSEITDFTGVGTNGKPLPEGWTGTASGNYTTDASAGVAAPSIAFKKDGEYIMTKTFDNPIRSLKFMYRFPSAGAGNIIKIEGLVKDVWKSIDNIPYVDLSKNYPVYEFSAEDNISAIKITFNKSAGNLSIDDIEIVSGYEIQKPIFENKSVNDVIYTPTELSPLTNYMYKVCAYHPAYTSDYSEPIYVTTNNIPLSVSDIKTNSDIKIYCHNGLVKINAGESIIKQVSLLSITGQYVYSNTVSANNYEFSVTSKGVYLLNIRLDGEQQTFKIIL